MQAINYVKKVANAHNVAITYSSTHIVNTVYGAQNTVLTVRFVAHFTCLERFLRAINVLYTAKYNTCILLENSKSVEQQCNYAVMQFSI